MARDRRSLFAPLMVLAIGLSGCTSLSTYSFPSFGFGRSSSSSSPDCTEIEQRMGSAHKKYAKALRQEEPAIYLEFTGNLSKTMKKNRLKGIYQMTDYHLDDVIDKTSHSCFMASLDNSVCRGVSRLGLAYKPLVLAARQAHENYCGNRVIR
ncbi:MAG: hypothetical protein GY927_21605 [bacterium]|nr:hypothetical protein [bacterium]